MMHLTCAKQQLSRKPTRPNQSPQPSHKHLRPQQLRFTTEFPNAPRVAIVGGGLAGLACAIELASHRIHSTVFDTGEHGVGGRAATRSTLDRSLTSGSTAGTALPPEQLLQFDHAAQYFVVDDDSTHRTVLQVV